MLRRFLPVLLAVGLLSPTSADAATPYRWTAKPVDAALAQRMHYTWHAGCPVPLKNLRYMTITYIGFDGQPHAGQMVVNADAVPAVARIFQKLYVGGFPVRRMRLVDDYKGDDKASMAADNTSGFNCRRVGGSSSWSQHAYGRAIDVNPIENPYVQGDIVEPPSGRPYAQRTPLRKGMVTRAVIDAFAAQGWGWGGNFRSAKDYQHFSRNGK